MDVTTSELARGLGVSERQIGRWRSGVEPRTYEKVAAIARYFGRSAQWFYTHHDDQPTKPSRAAA